MQRAGAAERYEREVARVEALLDRDDAERAGHLGVHHLDHGVGCEPPSARRAASASSSSPSGSRAGSAEQEVRVGHRRPLAAPPVAGRAGDRARALGPDPQRPADVLPHDRPATRADRVHGQGGEAYGEAADDALVLSLRLAADDRADVRRRPAHVERERVLEPGEGGDPRRPDDARCRAGEEREGRMLGGLVERREPSGRPHDERHGQAGGPAGALERAQVRGHDRAEVRVDGGGRRPLVLAELRRDLVRRDDVGVREAPPDSSATACSCVASRNEKRRQTATASASSSGRLERSSGSSSPSGPRRPRTPTQRSRGTSGGGWSAHGR